MTGSLFTSINQLFGTLRVRCHDSESNCKKSSVVDQQYRLAMTCHCSLGISIGTWENHAADWWFGT